MLSVTLSCHGRAGQLSLLFGGGGLAGGGRVAGTEVAAGGRADAHRCHSVWWQAGSDSPFPARVLRADDDPVRAARLARLRGGGLARRWCGAGVPVPAVQRSPRQPGVLL